MKEILIASIFLTIGLWVGLDAGDFNFHVDEIVWLDKPDTFINLGEAWDVSCYITLDEEGKLAKVDSEAR